MLPFMFNTLQQTPISSALPPIFLALVYALWRSSHITLNCTLITPRHIGFFAFLQISIYVPILGSLHILSHLPGMLFPQISMWLTPLLPQLSARMSPSQRGFPRPSCIKKHHPCLLPTSLYLVLWTECVPLKFICWSPKSQCDDIWRWGLWEVIRSWGWSPHE